MGAEMSSSRSGLETKQTVALQRIYTLHFTQTALHTLHEHWLYNGYTFYTFHTLHFTQTMAFQRIYTFTARSVLLSVRVMRIMMR